LEWEKSEKASRQKDLKLRLERMDITNGNDRTGKKSLILVFSQRQGMYESLEIRYCVQETKSARCW
jgi:hypothetical protein